MSAILELKQTPESCRVCEVSFVKRRFNENNYFCKRIQTEVTNYTNIRHPDCPLKITEDNLRWKVGSYDIDGYTQGDFIECPKCGSGYNYSFGENEKIFFCDRYKHCPLCGIKLLPPEE